MEPSKYVSVTSWNGPRNRASYNAFHGNSKVSHSVPGRFGTAHTERWRPLSAIGLNEGRKNGYHVLFWVLLANVLLISGTVNWSSARRYFARNQVILGKNKSFSNIGGLIMTLHRLSSPWSFSPQKYPGLCSHSRLTAQVDGASEQVQTITTTNVRSTDQSTGADDTQVRHLYLYL